MFTLSALAGLLLPVLAIIVVVPFFRRSVAERDLTRRIDLVVRGADAVPQRNSTAVLLGMLSQLGAMVQRLSILSEKDVAELGRAARSAGYTPERAIPMLIGGKVVLMVACPVGAFFLTRSLTAPWPIVYTCVGIVVGLFGPNLLIRRARNARKKLLRLGLSDALDLLVVCAEAGLGLESAIDRVSVEMAAANQPVAEEFAILGQDLRLSSDRGAALLRMGERTGLETFQRLTSTLSQTLRYGTPLGQALRLLASEMRSDRLLRLEEKAARLPTLLTLPLAVFILPCLFIVVAGPAALRVMNMMN